MKCAALIVACLVGVVARLSVSTLGSNYDVVTAFWPVAQGLADSPYPVLSWGLFRGLGLFAHNLASFHVALTAVLSCADVATALMLAWSVDVLAGVLWMLCPVGILLTGYHSQLEPIAIACALAGYLLLRRGKPVFGGFAMVVGLLTKQVFVLFPLAVVAWRERSLRDRLMFIGICYVPFVILWYFVPPAQGVQYGGAFRWGLIGRYYPATPWTIPVNATALLPLFFTLVVAITTWAAWTRPALMLPIYVAALLAFSPSVSDTYLLPPMLAWAMTRSGAMWVFTCVSTTALLSSHNNVGWFRDWWPTFGNGYESSLVPQAVLLAAVADFAFGGCKVPVSNGQR